MFQPQWEQLTQRVTSGRLYPDVTRRQLQAVIEGRPVDLVPDWPIPTDTVERVKQQLRRYESIGITLTTPTRQHILAQAAAFSPISETDRPLITGVFGYTAEAFDILCRNTGINAYGVERLDETIPQGTPVRWLHSMKPTKQAAVPRLVHFEWNSYQGLSPEEAFVQARLDGSRLAGLQVLEMTLVEPQWILETHQPYLSGYYVMLGNERVTPYLWAERDLDLALDATYPDGASGFSASPTVWEC